MIALVLTILLAAGAVTYVAWPLISQAGVAPNDEPEVDVLRERQQAAVEALRELDYERQIGKLTEPEYFALRERYARQAMALLKVLDQRDAARDQALEQAIAARRGAAATTGASAAASTARKTTVARPPARARRTWLTALVGALLAIVIAVGLLASTVHRGAAQPEVVGQVVLPAPQALTFDPSQPGRLLAANGTTIQASNDGGKTWSTVAAHWPAAVASGTPDILSLFAAPDGKGVEALVQGIGIERSLDGGKTWSPPPSAPALPAGARAVATTGGSPALLVVATANGMQASSDGGRNWAIADGFVNGLLPTKDVRDVVYAATADQSTGPQGQTFRGLLFVATDRGLFASNDGAQSWFARPLGGNLVAVAVDPANPSTILAMDAQGQLFRSDDGGQTWLSQNG